MSLKAFAKTFAVLAGFYGTVVCFVYLLYEILKTRTHTSSDPKI
jgi:hypothetical protein